MYTVYFKNPNTGEFGDIVQWERPAFTHDMFKIIMSELQSHAYRGWENVLAILLFGGFSDHLVGEEDADILYRLDTYKEDGWTISVISVNGEAIRTFKEEA